MTTGSQSGLIAAGALFLLLLSPKPAAPQTPPAHKPPLTLHAVALPKKSFLYQVLGSRAITSYAEVACVVKNTSRSPITIYTYTANWYENWDIDGWPAKPIRFACSANLPMSFALAPGETYAKTVPITFDDAKVGQMVSFRVEFVTDPDSRSARNLNRRGVRYYTVFSVPIRMRVPERTVHQ